MPTNEKLARKLGGIMRPWHTSVDDALYFITTHCKRKIEPFRGETACSTLLKVIRTKQAEFQFGLFGYVVMPDHYHLLLQLPEKGDISKILNHINGASSRMVNEILPAKLLHIWQGGFYDVMVRNPREFAIKVNYIHDNPVKRGLVTKPVDYPYSSARFYFEQFGDCYLDPLLDEDGLDQFVEEYRTVLI